MSVTLNGTSGLTFNDATTQNTSAFYGGLAFRNRIINGSMQIDQRNAGASVTANDSVYPVDRWKYEMSQSSKGTSQQNQGSVTPPAGFSNYLGFTSSSAYSVLSSDYFWLEQYFEGFNTADLNWGTANASTVTLSFWVRSSLTGTFGGSLTNNNVSRCFPFSYTINAANTWEQKSVTIVGDTSGTWVGATNGNSIRLHFSLGTGSTRVGGTSAWGSTDYRGGLTGSQSVVGTNGATFYITGVQLEKGSTATSFDYRPYGTELALCQRYCNVIKPAVVSSGVLSGIWYTSTGVLHSFIYPVQMRSAPTLSVSAASDFAIVSGGNTDAASAFSLAGASAVSTRVDVTSSFGRTTGNGSVVQTSNTSASLTFSAEL